MRTQSKLSWLNRCKFVASAALFVLLPQFGLAQDMGGVQQAVPTEPAIKAEQSGDWYGETVLIGEEDSGLAERRQYDPVADAWSGVEKGAEPYRRAHSATTTSSRRSPVSHRVYQYMPDASRSFGLENMLADYSKEVAGKIYYELKEEGQRKMSSRVAVVAAVPLADLKRETEFGRIIAEYYLTDLADRGIRVTELRMGRDINVLPQTGEFILSRNIGELANNAPALDYVVVSTFTNTRKTLILQGRLVSLKTGLVKTSWRYSLPLNRELLGLFYSSEHPYTIAVKGIGQ